jgi:hypothetical protein
MLSTLTPIVAQSSDDASLTTSGMVPVGVLGVVIAEPESALPPPPQAVRVAARTAISAPPNALLNILRCISRSLCLVHRRLLGSVTIAGEDSIG